MTFTYGDNYWLQFPGDADPDPFGSWQTRNPIDPGYISEMPELITVPFSHLVLRHREIGIHRGRRWGFRDVFGFATLRDVSFVTLANRVKHAYEGRNVPDHCGWPTQREALRWLVEKGRDGIYVLDDQPITLMDERLVVARRRDAIEDQTIKLADSTCDTIDEQGIKLADSMPDLAGRTPDAIDAIDDQRITLADENATVLDDQIEVADRPDRYYISDGHHRALALYVLGEDEVCARVLSKDELRARVKR